MKKKGQEKGRNTFGNWVVKEKKKWKENLGSWKTNSNKNIEGLFDRSLRYNIKSTSNKKKKINEYIGLSQNEKLLCTKGY